MKKNKKIIVDRTVFNVYISSLSNKQISESEIHVLSKVIKRIAEEEKKENKPIMDISMDILEAEKIFQENIDNIKFLCVT